ncbi:unnamed protein product [Kuraishia capsulata CBS 1993]|uniref:Something about silencing protein 4 domain-containing protein n=1 Tax=Kuraishia capsulata CBS 1993 TaxID=1382522 RepID=W6MNV2_9ASCO|nr:uncharacterized protein KUCA_T00004288001 [Kuraishia capsulata CBS 1993]CDK28306.1 unnamed protein product [Kuraishia capsulata CBS 1993]
MNNENDRRHLRSTDGGKGGTSSGSETAGLDGFGVAFTSGGWEPFDFDAFLETSVPEQLSIEIVNILGEGYEGFIPHENPRLNVQETVSNPVLEKGSSGVLANVEDVNTKTPSQPNRRGIRHSGHRDYSEAGNSRKRQLIDPLDDQVYFAYHKRREKEEKKMSNLDKNRLLSDYDTFREYLTNLTGFGKTRTNGNGHEASDALVRALTKITKIDNPADHYEVNVKYNLTMRELGLFTKTYDDWRSREAELKRQLVENSATIESDSEGDENLANSRLRKKRLKKRGAVFGPIVKINFLDNITLVMDPLLPPKVIRKDARYSNA